MKTFRSDINALRALAVISVIIFHISPMTLKAGFIGVDIFFVISGFLMSRIIFMRSEEGRFNLKEFYLARIQRICPSLLFTVFLVLFVCFFLLSPKDYKQLSIDSISSLSFVSNIVYWKTSGYFDTASLSKWLLHTWSLSVEWQFYLFYPLLILGVIKFTPKNKVHSVICFLVLFSFVVNLIVSELFPTTTYYLITTRAWEMLLGYMAYKYSLKENNNAFLITAIILFLISYVIIDKSLLWPGYFAILPTIATVFVIISSSVPQKISENKIVDYLGKSSYSLYLIHWPLLVFYNFFLLEPVSWHFILSLLAISHFSYSVIEKKRSLKFISISYFILILFSVFIYLTNGFYNRVDSKYQYNKHEEMLFKYGGDGFPSSQVNYLAKDRSVDYIFFGDSYAQQYLGGFVDKAKQEGISLNLVTYFDHGCLVSPSLTRFNQGVEDTDCTDSFSKVEQLAAQYPLADIVIGSMWAYQTSHKYKSNNMDFNKLSNDEYFDILSGQLDEIKSMLGEDRKYYLIGVPVRDSNHSAQCLGESGLFFSKECKNSTPLKQVEVNSFLNDYVAHQKNVYFIDVADPLCDDVVCKTIEGRFPIFSDGHHLSRFGSAYLAPYVLSHLPKIAGEYESTLSH